MAATLRGQEEILRNESPFRRNAFLIINKMLALNNLSSGSGTVLVDEILHSIFFLGKIHIPPISPEMIVSDVGMFNELKGRYPGPFEYYSSQLPKRGPFSCVLDMVVQLTGRNEEEEIIAKLREIIRELVQDEKKALCSSTICVSQKTVRYYGVSMSCSQSKPGKVTIAASCLSNWDGYVAGAVMTYYPVMEKKVYFDGTIKLPESVSCKAFKIVTGEPMEPCTSCGNLFGLQTSCTWGWNYGNCAEVESVSNLLKNEAEVREEARPTSETYTEENRQRAEKSVLAKLKEELRQLKFEWKPPCKFYKPKEVPS